MGQYLYIDENGHQMTVTHRMLYTTSIVCSVCDAEMWRKPQPITVTWGGMAPSQGELHPEIRGLIDTADERRDAFEAEHEAHERRSEELDNG